MAYSAAKWCKYKIRARNRGVAREYYDNSSYDGHVASTK